MLGAEDNRTPLLVIVGPTATGKTAVSIHIARLIGAEIISADSMLIYRHMDIGTAKPSIAERGGVPHHMIDIINPDENFNVSMYCRHALNFIKEITKTKKIPMLVGGTGLYIKSVIEGYNFCDAGSDPQLREKLLLECEAMGRQSFYNKLKDIDPETASRLHYNDVKRVIRALEVYYLSGKTISAGSDKQAPEKYRLLLYGLEMDRRMLYARIENRVDEMLKNGLMEEVRGLLVKGYSEELTSMQGLGYKEIIQHLSGNLSLEEALQLLKKRTRNFAKRQLTWFRRDARTKWINVGERKPEQVAAEIKEDIEGVFKTASNDYKILK